MRIEDLVRDLKSYKDYDSTKELIQDIYEELSTLDSYDVFEILEELYDEDELREILIEKIKDREEELESMIEELEDIDLEEEFEEEEEEDWEEDFEEEEQ